MTGSESGAHPTAVVECELGADCRIGAFALIESEVRLGEAVVVGPGARVLGATQLAERVCVGANAVLDAAVVGPRAQVGANATLIRGVRVGRSAVVEAGAFVESDVPPNAVVAGNPAAIRGYVDSPDYLPATPRERGTAEDLGVSGVRLVRLPVITDLRGSLSFGEQGNPLPFAPVRYFCVFDVPDEEVRGEHAHKELEQFLVCVSGAISIVVDDGTRRAEVRLDNPGLGLYAPPMTWTVHYKYSPGSVLLVLASAPYDADDYIRDYEAFLEAV